VPRRKAPPRLYLDPARKQWIIRDGTSFIRTGCAEHDHSAAEKQLARYIGHKHRPEASGAPLIADVLNVYAAEHIPHTRSKANAAYQIAALADWWGDRTVSAIAAKTCRDYAAQKTPAAGRRDLETLRAALGYWHKHYGPLDKLPSIVLPEKPTRRTRWLTRSEVARLLWAARRTQHLARFILIGLYTGSRSGVILRLKWSQVDLLDDVMYRIGPTEAADKRKDAPPVRLGQRILSHLRRWKRLDGHHAKYVCHYHGGRVVKMRRSWAAARKRAGLDASVTPHTLRHTRATRLMQRGVNRWEAAGSLGMTVETLERTYGHHHPDWQKGAAEV
jgi:integrase